MSSIAGNRLVAMLPEDEFNADGRIATLTISNQNFGCMMLKPKIRRFIKWVTILTVLGLFLLAAVYHFRNILFAPHIERMLEKSIESQTGIRVDIAGIRGSYITDLVVMKVTTLKPAISGPLTSLRLERMRVAYNPLSLLGGIQRFLADASVELQGAELEFNLSGKGMVSKPESEKAPSGSFFLPNQLPRIRISKTAVHLQGSDYGTAFSGIELEIGSARSMPNTIELQIADWSWTHPHLQDGNTAVTAVIEYSKDRILVKKILFENQKVAAYVQIGLNGLPETIPFEAHLNLASGKVALEGKLDHSTLDARMKAENLESTRLFSLFNPQKPPLTGILALEANIGLPLENPEELKADLDLKLIKGSIFGIAADTLNLQATAIDGNVSLDLLDMRSAANLIQLREVKAQVAPIFQGNVADIIETSQGTFSIDCRDLPALFAHAKWDLTETAVSIPKHKLLLGGELNTGTLSLSGGGLSVEGGNIQLGPSQITLGSLERGFEDSTIRADLNIDLPNLELLSRIFPIPKLGGSLQGNIRVAGTFRSPRGQAIFNAQGISYQGVTYGDLKVEANADAHSAIIKSIALQRGQNRLMGQGTFYFDKQKFE
ncbi:MAG: hypothetical protein KJO34_03085, partial [Deltaproteobacteria bacterium]|nr:hypothetical protein [Deltaproteobacteria bacterium]